MRLQYRYITQEVSKILDMNELYKSEGMYFHNCAMLSVESLIFFEI
jgi:hypothetical protein